MGPGATAAHCLTVTAEGDPDVRAAARRWLRRAPAPDATWEYADTKQRGSTSVAIRVGDVEVGFDEMVVVHERAGSRLDVQLGHPRFADLPQDARVQVSFLALDEALGELDVELWIGGIEPLNAPPAGGISLDELVVAVDALAAEHRGDDGEPSWAILQGETPDGPVIASTQIPLAAAWAPHLDQYVSVEVPFADRTDVGWPGPGSLDALLRDFEDHLSSRLGTSGRCVAHETVAGVRRLHFYVESTGPGADVIGGAVGGWNQGRVSVSSALDPRWDAVAHLRT